MLQKMRAFILVVLLWVHPIRALQMLSDGTPYGSSIPMKILVTGAGKIYSMYRFFVILSQRLSHTIVHHSGSHRSIGLFQVAGRPSLQPSRRSTNRQEWKETEKRHELWVRSYHCVRHYRVEEF